MSGVAAQWSLDATSTHVLSIGRGLLAASTSDNVQPIALLACESFGSTLAMSPETIMKVEKIILPSPPPAVLQFLKVQVGFFKDDSASYFGHSAAGVRFLGLAAALVTLGHSDNAVFALDLMLRKNKTDLTLLPTVRQLHALLDALKRRCHRGDFASSLLGWHRMLNPIIHDLPPLKEDMGSDRYDFMVSPHLEGSPTPGMLEGSPTPDMLEQLVDVFRQVARIGESTIVGATIKISHCLVWIVAFSRWCLGSTPRVIWGERDGEGTNILPDDPQSRITIIACGRSRLGPDIEIAIHDGLGTRLNRLVVPKSPGMHGARWKGMTSVQEYGAWRLHQLQIEHNLSDLDECMAHVIPMIARLFQADALDAEKVPPGMTAQRCDPFRDYRGFDEAYDVLLQRPPPEWKTPDEQRNVGVMEMLASLGGPQPFWPSALAKKEEFIDNLSRLALDIVAISILESPDTAHCCVTARFDRQTKLWKRCNSIFTGDPIASTTFEPLGTNAILEWTAALLGQRKGYEANHILSSGKGQVMYIESYGSLTLRATGYLRLSLLPGEIRYKNEAYSRLEEPNLAHGSPQPWRSGSKPKLSGSSPRHNQYIGCSVQWSVTLSSIDEIVAMLRMGSESGGSVSVALPSYAIKSMASAVMAVRCGHTGGSSPAPFLEDPNFMDYIGMTSTDVPHGAVGIVAVSGHDQRFLAAACHWGQNPGLEMVIRQDACFNCCIRLCLRAHIRILIL